MDLKKYNKIHLIGVGGIGISALAKYFIAEGKVVSGSDLHTSFITDDLVRLGAKITVPQQSENVPSDVDLVVYSAAVPDDNVERLRAAQLGITQCTYPQALGALSAQYAKSVAVSGNKGKTTTTAMLACILDSAALHPTAVVGSYVNNWQSNFLKGSSSEYFVFEACEYKEHMNEMQPTRIILTNLEPDHLDYYGTFEKEVAAFQKYINKLPAEGVYFYNADDPGLTRLEKPKCHTVSYGLKNKADVMALARKIENGVQSFAVSYNGNDLGRFELELPGLFNVYNALAAIAAALELNVAPELIKKGLLDFQGTWRRFHNLGQYNGAQIISDYAHHPTAIRSTIDAAREFFPGRRILVAFEPHHHHRTLSLFQDFVQSFGGSDALFISEIYKVAGRDNMSDAQVSSRDLVNAIKDSAGLNQGPVEYTQDLVELESKLKNAAQEGDVILLMGAGDIFKVAEKLVSYK